VAWWKYQKMSASMKKCELATAKISKVLYSISEVINWMERRVIVIISIFYVCKTLTRYVTKKRHQLLRQKKISDYFKDTN
jgi:hypothetical protein